MIDCMPPIGWGMERERPTAAQHHGFYPAASRILLLGSVMPFNLVSAREASLFLGAQKP